MGKGKPLFEILQEQKAQQGGQLNFTQPGRKQPTTGQAASGDKKAAPPPAAPHGNATAEPADRPAASEKSRLLEPKTFQFSPVSLGLLAACVLILVGLGFGAGHWYGRQAATTEQQNYQAAAGSLTELQQEPNPDLLPAELGGVGPHNARYSMGDGEPLGEDPRIAGRNYFRLIEVPANSGDEIYRIVEFLREREVDAAVVPLNNGRLKVVAMEGFERPRSDPEAVELQEKLLRLGRLWKSEHGGSTDWRDLMAEKYRPGVN